MNKYCTKVKLRAPIGQTQNSNCQRITPLPIQMTQNVSDAMYFAKMQEDFLRKVCSCLCYLYT